MAKEFKTINVSTANEERTVRAFQGFGWTLKGNQVVHNRDSHLEAVGNTLYSVTQTIHYVKLSFERDGSKLKYYQQLRQLEDMFWSVPEPKKPDKKWANFYIIMYAIFGLFAFLMFIIPVSALNVPGLMFAAVAALNVYLHYQHKQKVKAWQEAYNKCWRKREQILAKAEPYLE